MPVVAAIVASVLLGAVPFFAKHLYVAGLKPESLLFLRYWLALLLMIPCAVIWRPRSIKSAFGASGLILWMDAAFLGTIQTYCFFEAVRTGPSSIPVICLFCFPPIILAIERVMGRTVPLTDFVCAAVVLGGAITAISPTINGELNIHALVFAFASPWFYSVYLLIAAPRMRELDPLIGAILVYLGLGSGYALVVLGTGLALPHNIEEWTYMVVIALFGGAIASALITFSVPRLGPGGYGIIGTTEVVTVVAFGALLLGEQLTAVRVLGIVAVCVGMILYAMRKKRASTGSIPSV